jgi:hypothetical protein
VRDGLNLPEPDAAFMKQVEHDPFPRAEQTQLNGPNGGVRR